MTEITGNVVGSPDAAAVQIVQTTVHATAHQLGPSGLALLAVGFLDGAIAILAALMGSEDAARVLRNRAETIDDEERRIDVH